MFEVVLASVLGMVFGFGAAFWSIARPAVDEGQDFSAQIATIEGKLTMVLERIEEAMEEIEPPSVAEHITGAFSAWFQNKMLRDQVGMMGGTILEPLQQHVESWPAAEHVQSVPAEEIPSP